MIEIESQKELALLDDLYRLGTVSTDKEFVVSLTHDAIEEAISSDNVEEHIIFILKNYPRLTNFLIKVVSDKYPEHLNRLNKLIVLA